MVFYSDYRMVFQIEQAVCNLDKNTSAVAHKVVAAVDIVAGTVGLAADTVVVVAVAVALASLVVSCNYRRMLPQRQLADHM